MSFYKVAGLIGGVYGLAGATYAVYRFDKHLERLAEESQEIRNNIHKTGQEIYRLNNNIDNTVKDLKNVVNIFGE